jgi:hypothetical protein
MTAPIRYEDVLRYVDPDAAESGLDLIGFLRTLALFTPIMERLGGIASPEALDHVYSGEMIARVILGEQKFAKTEAPRHRGSALFPLQDALCGVAQLQVPHERLSGDRSE